MTVYNKLDEKVFASQAKPRETENFPNIARGWGISFEQTAGIPPMEWFNGLFKRIDEHILYLAQRGLAEWSSTLEYPQGAYVQYNGKTYRSLRQHTNQRPNVPSSSYWERWGFNLSEIGRATLTTFGLTQLTNETGLDSETLALTAKAGKALSQRIAQNQQAIAGLNSGKVDKTAISNAVNSTSQTNVASSQAAKTAYDKGVEAKNAADNAQRTADSKLGNTGNQTLNNGVLSIVNDGWVKLRFSTSQQNRYGSWDFQTNMHGLEHQTHLFRARLMHEKEGVRTFTDFPYADGNQVVAYQSWVKREMSTFKIPVKGGNTAVDLDLSRRSQIIREIGDVYKGSGRYYLTFHNTLAQHRITNLPLGEQRGSLEIVVSVMGGYSFLECYYLTISRRFFASVNWNEENLILRWQEMLTNSHDGKTVIRHNAAHTQPTMHFLDEATNLDAEITQRKIISNIEYRAAKGNQPNGEIIAMTRIHLLPSKQSEIEVAGKNSERQWVRYLTHFSSNGATNLGGVTNNGRDRLQVSGTISATAPETAANNDQLPTTAWVRNLVNAEGIPVGSIIAFPKEITHPQGFLLADGSTFGQQTYPDLYRTLGNKNKLPNLKRSDVGMTAYFAVDNIPDGWIPFDNIRTTVTQQNYPELYQHLVDKYGSINRVPLAEDRFIRNAATGLNVGQTQGDAIRNITGEMKAGNVNNGNTQFIDDLICSGAFGRIKGNKGWTSDYNADAGQAWGANFDASRVVPTSNENRPKSIVLKLCIKAKNTFDDVRFWIKAFGTVQNAGALDASRLAQDIQQVRAEKAGLNHAHTYNQITDFEQGVLRYLNQGFTQNLSETGWTKLPNGLILQWGKVRQGWGETSTRRITYPIAFPRACVFVGLTEFTEIWSYATTVQSRAKFTKSYAEIVSQRNDSMFFAIGY